MNNEVQLKIEGKKGFFYIEIEGKQEAMMTFVFAGEDMEEETGAEDELVPNGSSSSSSSLLLFSFVSLAILFAE